MQIQYNLLNLPSKTTFGDGGYINYQYSASGMKQMVWGSAPRQGSKSQFYLGNYVYGNGVKQLLVDGGYVTFSGSTPVYHFYLKDHLGNNRIVASASGTVEQVNHYYPFGGLMAESTGGDVQRFKYNGKELDRMHGLDWYDYGARHMDGARGQFTSIDKKAEKYYSISPYLYCENNPIRKIDIKGLEPGDFFRSADEAAKDFGLYYNDNSIRENREFGSTIFKIVNSKGEKGYTYTIANVGSNKSVIVSDSPFGFEKVATIHTHAAYDENSYNNVFSGIRDDNKNLLSRSERAKQTRYDIGNANIKKIDSYLVSPNGRLQKYEPKNNKISIISDDMPSDFRDPDRLNNIDTKEKNSSTMEDLLRMIKKIYFHK